MEFSFGVGWRSFLAENRIKIGDFLILEVPANVFKYGDYPNIEVDIVRYGYDS